MTVTDTLLTALATVLPEAVPDRDSIAGGETVLDCPPEHLLDAFRALTESGSTVHLSAITALPADSGTLLLYHLWIDSGLTLCVHCPRNEAPSLTPLLPAASWYEREAHDMLGIRFIGHPNLEPLLLAAEWSGPPPLARQEKTDA